MAFLPGTALAPAGLCSNAAFSRAGGGSPSERAHCPTEGSPGVALPRELRLRRRKDFDAVFRGGRAWNNDLLVLRCVRNNMPHNRFGFVTSKRLGRAVVRNRVRRRLQEAVRPLPLRQGWDIVFSAKVAAAQASYHDLRRSAAGLLARAGILLMGPNSGEADA